MGLRGLFTTHSPRDRSLHYFQLWLIQDSVGCSIELNFMLAATDCGHHALQHVK